MDESSVMFLTYDCEVCHGVPCGRAPEVYPAAVEPGVVCGDGREGEAAHAARRHQPGLEVELGPAAKDVAVPPRLGAAPAAPASTEVVAEREEGII